MRACKDVAPRKILAICVAGLFALNGCGNSIEMLATWNQSSKTQPQWLIPLRQGFCYLTGISGDFTSDKEEVFVGVQNYPGTQTSPVFWQVSGTSSTKAVTATAGCSFWSSFNMKEYYVQNPPWVSAVTTYVPGTPGVAVNEPCCPFGALFCSEHNLAYPTVQCRYEGGENGYWRYGDTVNALNTTNSFCSLNGIRGGFNGFESVSVEVVPSATLLLFQLRVIAPTPNDTVSGTASCVSFSPADQSNIRLSRVYTWTQNQNQPVDMIPGSKGVCFLTAVSGKFRGKGEYVEIEHDTANPLSSTPQRLTGHSDQINVSVEARCIEYKVGRVHPK
jgi:hypothetical protein